MEEHHHVKMVFNINKIVATLLTKGAQGDLRIPVAIDPALFGMLPSREPERLEFVFTPGGWE